jgi:anti-sigma factor ChrR (cupin superfamily)
MKLHADLDLPAVVAWDSLPWTPSPLAGVERRMLERDGDEVARVTSVVRYAPGSRFAPHEHRGGEEFLVLDGVFSDEHGDFPAGTYVRNPVGSRHTPHSVPGCTILVKLWWMHAEDQSPTCIDTRESSAWVPCEGGSMLALHSFGRERTWMQRLDRGGRLPQRRLPGGEEIFVLEGSCRDAEGDYAAHTWIRRPVGEAPELASDQGAVVLIAAGRFASPPSNPAATDATLGRC